MDLRARLHAGRGTQGLALHGPALSKFCMGRPQSSPGGVLLGELLDADIASPTRRCARRCGTSEGTVRSYGIPSKYGCPSPVPYRRAGRLVGLAMSASRSCPSSTPPGDDCGRTIHRICKRVPWCESIWAPVAHRLKRFKILGADFRSDHLHDSSSDVLSRTGSLSLPDAIATQRGIARTQAQRWTCSAAHELQVHR